MAAVGTGWPLGRCIVILLAARAAGEPHWRTVCIASSSMLVGLAGISLTCFESPRHLLVHGDEEKAKEVLGRIFAQNGTPFDADRPL